MRSTVLVGGAGSLSCPLTPSSDKRFMLWGKWRMIFGPVAGFEQAGVTYTLLVTECTPW